MDMSPDDTSYNHDIPTGGAYDIGRLEDGSSTALDSGGTNGDLSSEFYHSGKNKGSLRFDRY